MPPARRWKPGNVQRAGRVDPDTVGWVDTNLGKVILKAFQNNDMQGEEGLNCNLIIKFFNGGFRTIDLTALTEAEVNALGEFAQFVFDTIIPTIRRRDEVAREAFGNGDRSFARSYRAVPKIVIAERPPGEHGEVVLQRPEDDAVGNG